MKFLKILTYTATVAVMAVIFFFSSQNATVSDNISQGIVKHSVDTVIGRERAEQTKKPIPYKYFNVFLRKLSHFSLYMALGFFAFASACFLLNCKGKNIVVITLLFCLLYAASDEIHQLFVPGRAFLLYDILIDFAGAWTGILLATVIGRNKKCANQ